MISLFRKKDIRYELRYAIREHKYNNELVLYVYRTKNKSETLVVEHHILSGSKDTLEREVESYLKLIQDMNRYL